MTREELKAHCERQIEQFERVEKIMPVTPNDWKRYEEHKFVLELLEQEPCEDARSAVMHILKELGYGDEENGADAEYMSALCDVAEKVKSLPPVTQTSQWIPVSDRLPTEEEYIANNGLFIVSDGNRTYAEYFDTYDSMKYFGEPTMDGFRVDRCVIAWRPLPTPYRAESEAKG